MRIGEVAAALVVGAAALTAVGTGAVAQVTPGFVSVVDDTGRITIQVPATWSDVATAPGTTDDGAAVPTIQAAADLGQFRDTWSMSGVSYEAYPPGPAVADVMAAADLSRACAAGAPPVAYSNGGFTGERGRWSQCGGGTAGVDMIVAYPSDQSLLVVLLIVTAAPAEAAIMETIISSMDVVPAQTSQPLPTAVPVPVTSTVPAPTAAPPPSPAPSPSAAPTPTFAPAPTVAVPTGPPIPAPVPMPTSPPGLFTVAPSLETLTAQWNDLNQTLNGTAPDRFPLVPLSPAMFPTTPTGASAVFGASITPGAVLGGRVDPVSGAVTELFVLFDPDNDAALTVGLTPAAYLPASDLDAYVDVFRPYPAGAPVGERDHLTGAVSVVFESLAGAQAGDSLVAVSLLAPTDDATAFAASAALRQTVLATLAVVTGRG